MNTRIIALGFCLLCASGEGFRLSQNTKTKQPIRPISLREVGRYANQFIPGTLKLSQVVLVGFKQIENDWVYVFHLRDPSTGLQRGEQLTIHTNDFLICTDGAVGKPLLEAKNEWLGRKVNVYLIITDRGLTPNIYVGYVTKVELLDDKAQVVRAIQSET